MFVKVKGVLLTWSAFVAHKEHEGLAEERDRDGEASHLESYIGVNNVLSEQKGK